MNDTLPSPVLTSCTCVLLWTVNNVESPILVPPTHFPSIFFVCIHISRLLSQLYSEHHQGAWGQTVLHVQRLNAMNTLILLYIQGLSRTMPSSARAITRTTVELHSWKNEECLCLHRPLPAESFLFLAEQLLLSSPSHLDRQLQAI